ncbi:hypothetical protein [Actinomadura harenae]|nr:hypothetical protein [Actinomadura harenae]
MGNGIVEDNKMAKWLARLVGAKQTRPAPTSAPVTAPQARTSSAS